MWLLNNMLMKRSSVTQLKGRTQFDRLVYAKRLINSCLSNPVRVEVFIIDCNSQFKEYTTVQRDRLKFVLNCDFVSLVAKTIEIVMSSINSNDFTKTVIVINLNNVTEAILSSLCRDGVHIVLVGDNKLTVCEYDVNKEKKSIDSLALTYAIPESKSSEERPYVAGYEVTHKDFVDDTKKLREVSKREKVRGMVLPLGQQLVCNFRHSPMNRVLSEQSNVVIFISDKKKHVDSFIQIVRETFRGKSVSVENVRSASLRELQESLDVQDKIMIYKNVDTITTVLEGDCDNINDTSIYFFICPQASMRDITKLADKHIIIIDKGEYQEIDSMPFKIYNMHKDRENNLKEIVY